MKPLRDTLCEDNCAGVGLDGLFGQHSRRGAHSDLFCKPFMCSE